MVVSDAVRPLRKPDLCSDRALAVRKSFNVLGCFFFFFYCRFHYQDAHLTYDNLCSLYYHYEAVSWSQLAFCYHFADPSRIN